MSVINVSELMLDPDFMRDIILRRPVVHFANEGEAIASYEPDRTIKASPQPLDPGRAAEVPEGVRGSGDPIEVFTAEEIRLTNGKTDTPDIIEVDGAEYKVVAVEAWQAHGYYKAIAVGVVP